MTTNTEYSRELVDDFGNSIVFVWEVCGYVNLITPLLRFLCDGNTEKHFDEEDLKRYGYIE